MPDQMVQVAQSGKQNHVYGVAWGSGNCRARDTRILIFRRGG